MKRTILLLEDDTSLGEVLALRLGKDYLVHWARSKREGFEIAKTLEKIDLVILDVGLPDGTGFEFARELKHHSKPALVFLTAQSDAESRLLGYELGAEEYIPKPFHLKELLMRVEHVIERHLSTSVLSASSSNSVVEIKIGKIDFSMMALIRMDGVIEYPPVSDMKVLKFLVQQSPKAVSRDEIMTAVWGQEKNPSIRTIDNVIVRLRQLLEAGNENLIRSVRGVGYQWISEDVKEISEEKKD